MLAFGLIMSDKKNLCYIRGVMTKCVLSGEIHLRSLAPGQHSSEKLHSGGEPFDTVSALADPGIELQTSRTNNNVFNDCVEWPVLPDVIYTDRDDLFVE